MSILYYTQADTIKIRVFTRMKILSLGSVSNLFSGILSIDLIFSIMWTYTQLRESKYVSNVK